MLGSCIAESTSLRVRRCLPQLAAPSPDRRSLGNTRQEQPPQFEQRSAMRCTRGECLGSCAAADHGLQHLEGEQALDLENAAWSPEILLPHCDFSSDQTYQDSVVGCPPFAVSLASHVQSHWIASLVASSERNMSLRVTFRLVKFLK